MGTYGSYTGRKVISEAKKEEFTEHLLKILNYGGMMQFDVVHLFGREVPLIRPVQLNQEKEASFHYNYFEDDAWENAEYDGKSGYFYSEKIGTREFCWVIMAVYTLYELYIEDSGVAEINGDIINHCEYVAWINQILGTRFSMKKRFRLWDNFEAYAFDRMEYYDDDFDDNIISFELALRFIPKELRLAMGSVEWSDICYITKGTDSLSRDTVLPGTYPEIVYNCKLAIEEYLKNHSAEKDLRTIWSLVKSDRHTRQNLRQTNILPIAELSLKLPARVIVYLTAEIKQLSFWKIWSEIKSEAYTDEIMDSYASEEIMEIRRCMIETPILPLKTSAFLRDNGYFTFYGTPEELKEQPNYYVSDDDRIFWWDGTDEVSISADMDQWLKELSVKHHIIMEKLPEEPEDSTVLLKKFIILLYDINEYYERIYCFQDMFYDFIQSGWKKDYLAAVKLLEILAEQNREPGKIIKTFKGRWDINSKNVTHNPGRIQLKRYLSLMANKKLRKKYFNF